MRFEAINKAVALDAHNKVIDLLNTRGAWAYADFNVYDAINPKMVFPLCPVPWNAGYTTMVVIQGKFVGYPVFRNRNVRIFVGVEPTSGTFYVFYSKTRHIYNTSNMKIWGAISPEVPSYFDERQFAQKFGISLVDAMHAIHMIHCQAVRAFNCCKMSSQNLTNQYESYLENHPRYSAQIARRKKRNALAQKTAVAAIAATQKVPEPTVENQAGSYVFMVGSTKLHEGNYKYDFDARTAGTRILLKAIADERIPIDSVMRISRVVEVCSFKISVV